MSGNYPGADGLGGERPPRDYEQQVYGSSGYPTSGYGDSSSYGGGYDSGYGQPGYGQSAGYGYQDPGYPGGYGAPLPAYGGYAPYGIDPRSGRPYSSKSKLAAGLLQIFVGTFGVGRFYTGHIGIAVAQLLTCGGFGIWSLIDGILMLTGSVDDADGLPLRD